MDERVEFTVNDLERIRQLWQSLEVEFPADDFRRIIELLVLTCGVAPSKLLPDLTVDTGMFESYGGPFPMHSGDFVDYLCEIEEEFLMDVEVESRTDWLTLREVVNGLIEAKKEKD